MRIEEAYAGWQAGRLRQEEAARLLGVCERSFHRYIDRYEEDGLQGLIDHRVGQISQRRAPVDEVMALTSCYRARHEGWSVKHYYAWYRRAGGRRSYTWVKRELQTARCARASGYALRPWHSTQAKADNLRATKPDSSICYQQCGQRGYAEAFHPLRPSFMPVPAPIHLSVTQPRRRRPRPSSNCPL